MATAFRNQQWIRLWSGRPWRKGSSGLPGIYGNGQLWRRGRGDGLAWHLSCGCCWRLCLTRCVLSSQRFHQRHAGSWASLATCSAALVIFLDSSASFSWILIVEDAVRKKHNLKLKSCMQELFLKSADENWGGSLKSKLLSEVISPNCSEDYKSSMFVVQTLY